MLRTAVCTTCSRRLQLALRLGVEDRYAGITPFDLGVRRQKTGEKQWLADLAEEAVQSSGICDSMEELKLFFSVIKEELIISWSPLGGNGKSCQSFAAVFFLPCSPLVVAQANSPDLKIISVCVCVCFVCAHTLSVVTDPSALHFFGQSLGHLHLQAVLKLVMFIGWE